jgi:hypothetical protein
MVSTNRGIETSEFKNPWVAGCAMSMCDGPPYFYVHLTLESQWRDDDQTHFKRLTADA